MEAAYGEGRNKERDRQQERVGTLSYRKDILPHSL